MAGRRSIDAGRRSSNTDRGTLWKALAAIFRPAKAMQNWRKAEFLLSRRLPRRGRCWPAGRAAGRLAAPVSWSRSGSTARRTCIVFGWRIAARPLARRLRLAAQCADALGRLLGRMHASGAAHRDLKAANLLVVEDGGELTRLPGRSRRPSSRHAGHVPATSPRSGAAGGGAGRPSLGYAVDLPAFSPRLSGGVFRRGHRLEAAVAGNRPETRRRTSAASRSAARRCCRKSELEIRNPKQLRKLRSDTLKTSWIGEF